jgi:hypothetical protein
MQGEAEKILRNALHSHLTLGRSKPLSYLPIQTIENSLHMSVDHYVQMAESKGLASRVFSSAETCINSGAVYLYEPKELNRVLAANKKTPRRMRMANRTRNLCGPASNGMAGRRR